MDLEEKVEELANTVISLRREILVVKAFIRQQGNMLKDLTEMKPKYGPHNGLKPLHLLSPVFPLKTQEELDNLEESINEITEGQYIQELRYLVGPEGLGKNVKKILAPEIVLKYNLTGLHNKRRLQDYPKFLDVLFRATSHLHNEHSKFIEDLRLGLRQMKSRHFRAVSARRKKEHETSALTDDPLLVKRMKEDEDE